MTKKLFSALVAACIALVAPPAWAQTKMTGSFVASRACAAKQAIKGNKNPGNIETEIGRSYDLLGANKTHPTHYFIRVPGADPERRWVAVDCGRVTGAEGEAVQAPAPAKSGKPEYVLALSWQPAFCETKPDKRECKTQTADRFDAQNFTLHGLWPQPNGNFYCGVSGADRANDKGNWDKLPEVSLDAATRKELETVMPGVQSQLDRHEWIKHGVCYGKDQQAYFADALRLTREVNGSAAQAFMSMNIGKEVSPMQIRAVFDQAFGAGAGERVRVSCARVSGRRMIGEITIGLSGPVTAETTLKDLIHAAAPTNDAGCPSGVVDAAGR